MKRDSDWDEMFLSKLALVAWNGVEVDECCVWKEMGLGHEVGMDSSEFGNYCCQLSMFDGIRSEHNFPVLCLFISKKLKR